MLYHSFNVGSKGIVNEVKPSDISPVLKLAVKEPPALIFV